MGVAEQIQEQLRQGRTPEEILDLLKGKGLSEANARKFLERAQAAVASGAAAPVPVASRSPASAPAGPRPDAADEDDTGDGTWPMATGAFFFLIGTLGTGLTYVLAKPGGKFTFLYGAILWGAFSFIRGLARWWKVRDERPFPLLPVGAGIAISVLLIGGVYVQAQRNRAQQRERAVQLVREEEQRRGIEAEAPTAALDPVSTYIVVLTKGAADPDSQREAAWRLGEMRRGARDAVPALRGALANKSANVRRGAAEALMKISPEDPAVVAEVKALFSDPSIEVWTIMGDFARQGDPEAQKAILAKLDDSELWSRERACGMLGTLRANPAFAAPPIIAKLKADPDWRIQAGCARALGALGSATPEVKAALDAVATSPQPDVKKAATDALAKLWP